MVDRNKNYLKPLKQKFLKRRNIISFDIETYGEDNKFYMGGIYSSEGYKPYYSKDEMIKAFNNPDFYGNTFCCATNLGFDLVGIYYNQPKWNHLDIVMSNGRMIFANITNRKNQRMVFLDSLNFAPLSVKVMGEILKLPKLKSPKALGKIPKNDNEKTELEIYNKRDCEVTYKFMQLLDKGFNELGGKTKTTISSTALDIYKRKFLPHTLKKEIVSLGYDVNDIIFKSYYGGRTEVFKRGKIENCNMYDINSLYPSVMVELYPNPNTVRHLKNSTLNIINTYEGVSQVTLYLSENTRYPLLPVRMGGKLIFPTGIIQGYYTHVELRKAFDEGYILLNIGETVYYRKEFYPFRDYVETLYAKRLEHKEINSPLEIVYKLLLNSLYGKFAQKNMEETVFFNKEFLSDEEIEKVRENPNTFMKDDNNGFISKKKICEEPFVFPILACYTTALARLKLYDFLKKYNGLYCDTDSIITKDIIPTSSKLGDMKLEYKIKTGVVVKPKMYYAITSEDKEIIKLKGVPKRLITKDGNTITINKDVFEQILKGDSVEYVKFTKLKEGVRRNLTPNSKMLVQKFISVTDNKRVWFKDFSNEELEDSKPIHLTRDDYND